MAPEAGSEIVAMNRQWVITIALLLAGAAAAAAWASGAVPAVNSLFASHERSSTSIAGTYPIRLVLPESRPFENPAAVAAALAKVAVDAKTEDFAERMGIDPDFAVTAKSPTTRTTASPGLVSIDFDLGQYGRSAVPDPGKGLHDSKPVIVGGQRVGNIALVIGDGATVSVDRSSLLALVGTRDPALADSLGRVSGDLVTFESLRSRDVAIRYDPLADAVVIESKS